MLEITGGRGACCDGVSRRDFFKVGALGLGGLVLPDLLRARAAQAAAPQAKAVILLWMGGSPSHYETFDPKPAAPKPTAAARARRLPHTA